MGIKLLIYFHVTLFTARLYFKVVKPQSYYRFYHLFMRYLKCTLSVIDSTTCLKPPETTPLFDFLSLTEPEYFCCKPQRAKNDPVNDRVRPGRFPDHQLE